MKINQKEHQLGEIIAHSKVADTLYHIVDRLGLRQVRMEAK